MCLDHVVFYLKTRWVDRKKKLYLKIKYLNFIYTNIIYKLFSLIANVLRVSIPLKQALFTSYQVHRIVWKVVSWLTLVEQFD